MSAKPRVSPGAAMVMWHAAATVAHVGLPVILGRRGPRSGWTTTRPGPVNLLGLLPLGLGGTGLAWCYVAHRSTAPGESVQISLTPEYLVASGPYQFSRNPMYVAEQAMWLGWTVFFGSRLVLAATVLLALGMNIAVRREERTLDSQFGSAWLDYRTATPRWL